MRETRLSGSEGGVPERASLPPIYLELLAPVDAAVKVLDFAGESVPCGFMGLFGCDSFCLRW